MGALFILPVAGVSIWVIYSALRHIRRGEVAPVWHQRLKVLLIIGVVLGIYCAFLRKSQPTAQIGTEGFPVPTTIHRLENEVWKKSELPIVLKIGAYLANFAFGIAVAMLPLKIAGLINQAKPDQPAAPQ